MAQTTAIKRRINAVTNTRQITKAMELVAASKMRRAQESALKSRDYTELASEILTRLREVTGVKQHPLFKKRQVKARLHVLITSDRGLAGAYNSNLFRQFAGEILEDQQEKVASKVIVVGKQGSRMVTRLKGLEVVAAYHNFPDHPTANDIRPILNTILGMFLRKEADFVDATYTHFNSSISQTVKVKRLLPAAFEQVESTQHIQDADFEPSPEAVLNTITQRLVESQVNQAFLEALASEHSMRMLAMKNATDNASDLIEDLTLEFNTARQAAITQELAEITGGAEAIK